MSSALSVLPDIGHEPYGRLCLQNPISRVHSLPPITPSILGQPWIGIVACPQLGDLGQIT